jgi:hypothetical protein
MTSHPGILPGALIPYAGLGRFFAAKPQKYFAIRIEPAMAENCLLTRINHRDGRGSPNLPGP